MDAFQHETFMKHALREAQRAALKGETPVGAIVADASGKIIGAAGNAPIATNDPTGHAEIRAIRAAGAALGNYRLTGAALYVTLEPCAMCAGAISHARIATLVIAASDPKGGAVWHGPKFFEQSTCHWRPDIVQGPYAEESAQMLRAFFRERRANA